MPVSPRQTRRAGLLVLLFAFVLTPMILWWALGEPPGAPEADPPEAAQPPAPDEPVLQGIETSDRGSDELEPDAEGPRDVGVRRGVVRSTEGFVLEGARVYLLKKPEAVGPSWQTTTGADGLFEIVDVDSAGHWIGVVCRGYLPAHLDGDAPPPPDEGLVFVLEPGPVVRIRATDGVGEALAEATRVHLDTAAIAEPWPLPGEAWAVGFDVVVPAGVPEVSVPVGTLLPVQASARYPDRSAVIEPHTDVARPPDGTVSFLVRPSCVLRLRVYDGDSGDPFARGFDYEVWEGDASRIQGRTSLQGGSAEVGDQLKPGAYRLVVAALGYRRQEVTSIELTEYGQVAEVPVTLARDPTLP